MHDLQIDVSPLERCRRGLRAVEGTDALCAWTRGNFRLELYDTGLTDRRGGSRIAYRFSDSRMGAEPIFEGDDFFASPIDAIDAAATIAAVLIFLSLRPGDAGADALAGYSERQTELMELYAEDLGLCASELKEAES